MMTKYIHIDYSDGSYFVRAISDKPSPYYSNAKVSQLWLVWFRVACWCARRLERQLCEMDNAWYRAQEAAEGERR